MAQKPAGCLLNGYFRLGKSRSRPDGPERALLHKTWHPIIGMRSISRGGQVFGMATKRYRWGPVQELIFLDRYSPKAAREDIEVGDTVVVMTSDDRRYPAKEVGVVEAVEGDEVVVRLKVNGEVIRRPRNHCDKPLETRPEQMWDRLARAAVQVEPEERREELEREFRWLLDGFRFVPGGRINAMLGTKQALTAYNCYVIPVRGRTPDVPADSRHAIIDTLGNMVEIMARGGGVGINLSVLRPRLAYVKGVNGKSSGSVSWGALFSFATGLVEQGGCFGPDVRIATDKGLIPARELAYRIDQGEFIQAWTHKGLRTITAAFRNGIKPLFRLTTKRGLQIEITADHKVGVLRDGHLETVPLRELRVGDEILTLLGPGFNGEYVPLAPVAYDRSKMSTRLNENVSFPTHLTEELAYLLGYWYGDGYVHIGKKGTWSAPKALKLAVAAEHQDIQSTLVDLIEKLFGVKPVVEPHGKGCVTVALYSRLVIEWLQQNGLLKPKAEKVRVPEAIFRSPASVMAAFVSGCFDADGANRDRKAGYGFDSLSEGMLRDLQLILAYNGIPSHLSKADRAHHGWRDIYRLSVTDAEFKGRLSRFMERAHRKKDIQGYHNHFRSYPTEAWYATSIPGRYYQGLVDITKGRMSYRALTRIQERLLADSRLEEAERVDELLRTLPDRIVGIESIGLSDVYDFEVDEVHLLSGNGVYTSNSRRGALMLILNVWHPDVIEFINAKRDFTAITNANISVGITEEFERALEEDGEWELVFPDTADPDYDRLWDGDLRKWKAMGKPVKVYQRVRARDLFRQIVESAWASAEPGFVRLDYANKMSNSWYFAPLISTNPCFAGSVRLATTKGYLTFEELYHSEESLEVLTDARVEPVALAPVTNGVGTDTPTRELKRLPKGVTPRPAVHVFLTRRNAPVFRLKTTHGYEVVATADHRFLTPAGWVELKDLVPGQTLFLQSGSGMWNQDRQLPPWIIDDPAVLGKLNARIRRGEANPPREWSVELGQILGWLVGDGYTYDDDGKPVVTLVFGSGGRGLLPRFRALLKSWFGVSGNVTVRNHTAALQFRGIPARFFRSLGIKPVKATEKRVPDPIWRAPKDAVIGFLQGLFTSDGTVNISCHGKSCSIRLTSSSEQLLKDVQLLLLNLGIVSRIYKRRDASRRLLPGSDRSGAYYTVHEQWELLLDKENRDRFAREIGFLTRAKQDKVERYIQSRLRDSDEELFVTEVASVEPAGIEHVYDTTEPVTHSIIANGLVAHQCGEQPLPAWGVCLLGHFNLARFVENGEVKWDELRKAARLAVRFLDNVIDITPYFFEDNERQQKMERRVGMGTMGLGEMLIHLGIRYGSPEAVQFVDKLYGFIAREAYLGSVELAKEKGPFPAFDAEKFLQSGFMKGMPEDIREAVRRHGIRNVTLMTQAPTGTTGTMAGTSTGIEPYYAWSYYRHGRLGRKEVLEPVVQEYFEAHPELGGDVKKLPPYFVTALQLTPEEHVRMQAAIQRWVDSAISKTANLPAHYTVEQTMQLYELAIKLGCKGVTIYRDRSRNEQVLVAKDEVPPGQQPEVERAAVTAAEAQAQAVKTGVGSASATAPVHTSQEAPAQGSAPVAPLAPPWSSPLEVEPRAVIGEVPEEVEGFTYRQKTIVGTARVVVNEYPKGQPFETIIVLGKGGMDITADAEAIGRLISLYLRTPSLISNLEKLALVVEQLRNIGGAQPFGFGPNRVLSMPDALAKALERYLRTRRAGDTGAASTTNVAGQADAGGSEPEADEDEAEAGGRGLQGASPDTAEPGKAEPGRAEKGGVPTSGPGREHAAKANAGTGPTGQSQALHGGRSGAAAPTSLLARGATGAGQPVAGAQGLASTELPEPVVKTGNGRLEPLAGADICPMCGQAQYVRIEGCGHCQNCGYTRC